MMRDNKKRLKPRKYKNQSKTPIPPETTLTLAHNLSTSISIIDFDNLHDESEAGCQKYMDNIQSKHMKTLIYSDNICLPSTNPENTKLFESRRTQADSYKRRRNYYTYDELQAHKLNFIQDNLVNRNTSLKNSPVTKIEENSRQAGRQVVSYPDVNVHVISMMISHLQKSLTDNKKMIKYPEIKNTSKKFQTKPKDFISNSNVHKNDSKLIIENAKFESALDKPIDNTQNQKLSELDTTNLRSWKNIINETVGKANLKNTSNDDEVIIPKLTNIKIDLWKENVEIISKRSNPEQKYTIKNLSTRTLTNGQQNACTSISNQELFHREDANKELKTLWKTKSKFPDTSYGKNLRFKSSPKRYTSPKPSKEVTLLKQMKSFLHTSSTKSTSVNQSIINTLSTEKNPTRTNSSHLLCRNSRSLLNQIGDSKKQNKMQVLLMKKSIRSSSEIACNIELFSCGGNRQMYVEPRLEEIYINERTKISKHKRRHHKKSCRIIEREFIKRPIIVASEPSPGRGNINWIPKVVKKVQNCYCYVKDVICDTTYEISENKSDDVDNRVTSISEDSNSISNGLTNSTFQSNYYQPNNQLITKDIKTLFCNAGNAASSIKNESSDLSEFTIHNPFCRKCQMYLANYIPFIPRALSDVKFPIHMKNEISMIKYRNSLNEQFVYLKNIANSIMVLTKVLKNIYCDNDHTASCTYSKCITSIFRIREICHSIASVNLSNHQSYFSDTAVGNNKKQDNCFYFQPMKIETVNEEMLKINQTFPVISRKNPKEIPTCKLERVNVINISSNKILLQWKVSDFVKSITCYYKVYLNDIFQCTVTYSETYAILENVNMSEPFYITIMAYTADGYCFSTELKIFVR